MAEALYGELDEARRGEFDAHIEHCENCGGVYGELRATLETMSARRRPDPGDAFWDGYWQRLEERIARDEAVVDASRFDRRRSFGSWGYRAAAVVLVLAAGVWMGRTLLAPQPKSTIDRPIDMTSTPHNPAPDPSRSGESPPVELASEDTSRAAPAIDAPVQDAPAVAVQQEPTPVPIDPEPGVVVAAPSDPYRFIDRSQVVLLSLLNHGGGDDTAAADYDAQRRHAGTLVAEGRQVQEQLNAPEDRRLRELVGQLQLILREIANLEADSDLDAVEMIRNRVDREGVLLQSDLTQMREASAGHKKETSGNAID
jgi:hypothetical protein